MANKIEETIAKVVSDRFAALAEPYLYLTPTSWSDRPSNNVESAEDPTVVPGNPNQSYFLWGFSVWGGPSSPSDIIAP
jgi:hypothetical protein